MDILALFGGNRSKILGTLWKGFLKLSEIYLFSNLTEWSRQIHRRQYVGFLFISGIICQRSWYVPWRAKVHL